MNEHDARELLITNLLEKAESAIAAAQRELAAGDAGLATNRIYYAAFYALCAVLLRRGIPHAKHSSVRAALHRDLIRPGAVATRFGRFYDDAFSLRQEADYNALAEFAPEQVAVQIGIAVEFVAEMRKLV